MATQTGWFRIGFLLTALAGLCIVAFRCYYVPFSHDEVATFLFYIQPGKFIPFYAHPDANGHFLTSLSSWLCFKVFGSSTLALRIPNLAAFTIMAFGVWKLCSLFRSAVNAAIFSAFFLLSWNFLAFFALCRGYGLSMALLLPAFYWFIKFLQSSRSSDLLKFVLLSQLALSANLTLVAVLTVLTGLSSLVFFRTKKGPGLKDILIYLFQFSLIYFWVRYGLYLKEAGALYYGAGESYWQVTFVSLMDTLFFKSEILYYLLLIIFVGMSLFFFRQLFKLGGEWMVRNYFSISYLIFCLLIIGFFLLKVLLKVNYPEDRTGLFFYVFFVSAFCFMFEEIPHSYSLPGLIVPVGLLIQCTSLLNFEYHPWRVYETMPQHFYDRLLQEQQQLDRPLTVGGHRVREFFYGFLNYNSPIKINHMTAPEALQMNCDYALAYRQDKPWYNPYYEEIEKEEQWGFRLLKRKIPLERQLIFSQTHHAPLPGKFLYSNLYEHNDTTFTSTDPLQADIDFSVGSTTVPLNLYIVLQIESQKPEEGSTFIRVPLNLIRYDWNGIAHQRISLVSGNLPEKIKRIVIYLWNIDQAETAFTIHSFNLYQLHGKGVKEISKASI